MTRPLDNETIKQFLLTQADTECCLENFGYLLIASDVRLNDEALFNIKRDFKEFVETESDTILDITER